MISILFYYLMSIKNCSKYTCSFTNCSFTNKSPPVPWQVSTAPGVGRTGGAPKGGRQKKLVGPPRILRGHQRAKACVDRQNGKSPPRARGRPLRARAKSADSAAGVISGGRPRATTDDRRLKNCDSRLPRTPADDRRSSAGVWTTAKKVGGPAARGPADARQIFL